MSEPTSGSLGPSTDRYNEPVIDPTQNVKDLSEAANKRQDDLREQESAHVREIMAIRAEHETEARRAEADRIDAIRQVDVQAVQQAAQVQATQAAALAAQVAASAEAMRSQVAATASAAATSQATALAPITASIEQLRQAMYEQQGKETQVVETRAGSANAGLWVGVAIAAVIMVLSAVGIIATIVIAVVTHGFK